MIGPALLELVRATKGFMPEDEGAFLHEQAPAVLADTSDEKPALLEVGSYCGKSIPAVNSDNDTVAWYDGDALNLSNVITNEEYWGDACYTDPPPDPTVSKGYCAGGGLCESASPGDSNYNSQAQIYLEIDLSAAANGCGAYTLQSDRATGYNWSLQSFCYDGSTQLGAQ